MKKFLIFLFSVLVLFSFSACSKKQESDPAPATESTVTEESTQEGNEAIFSVFVNGVERTTEDEWDELGEDEELIVLDVVVTNKTEEKQDFNGNYVSLIVDNEQVMVASEKAKGKEPFSGIAMEPGQELKGYLFYKVKKGSEIQEIRYDDMESQYEIKQ